MIDINFELTVSPSDEFVIDHHEEIAHLAGFDPFIEGCNWAYYSDMIAYSKKYPNLCFKIEYSYETDITAAYFENGKTYEEKARIVYNPYNKNLLK